MPDFSPPVKLMIQRQRQQELDEQWAAQHQLALEQLGLTRTGQEQAQSRWEQDQALRGKQFAELIRQHNENIRQAKAQEAMSVLTGIGQGTLKRAAPALNATASIGNLPVPILGTPKGAVSLGGQLVQAVTPEEKSTRDIRIGQQQARAQLEESKRRLFEFFESDLGRDLPESMRQTIATSKLLGVQLPEKDVESAIVQYGEDIYNPRLAPEKRLRAGLMWNLLKGYMSDLYRMRAYGNPMTGFNIGAQTTAADLRLKAYNQAKTKKKGEPTAQEVLAEAESIAAANPSQYNNAALEEMKQATPTGQKVPEFVQILEYLDKFSKNLPQK